MKLLSLNVGRPKPVTYQGKEVLTSIFKQPVKGALKVNTLNIEGDIQSDLTHHGGSLKAVYSYDISYYNHCQNVIERDEWSYGLFGENLTTEGLVDDTVVIGNVYQIGTVYLKAIQPRFPCFKLNIKFKREDMIEQFIKQARHGTYFSVVQEGSLQAGDPIYLIEASKHEITIQQLVEAYYSKGKDKNVVQQILGIDFLPERLRKAFESY